MIYFYVIWIMNVRYINIQLGGLVMKWILGSAVVVASVRFYGIIMQFLAQFSAQTFVVLLLSAFVLGVAIKTAMVLYNKKAEKVNRFHQALAKSGLGDDIRRIREPRKPAEALRPVHLNHTTYFV